MLKQKQFHFICVTVIVGFLVAKAIIAARNSIYIMVNEQLLGMFVLVVPLLCWIYEKVKNKERTEDVSNMMTAWYLGFAIAVILLNGIASIKEQDRLGREMRAKMTDEEWEELNEQIREDARQDYYESRHP